MCGQPLDQGSVEGICEFSTLNIMVLGFGLDLRWRGRGSALPPSPNIVIVSPDETRDRLNELFSGNLLIERVSEPHCASVYVQSATARTPLTAIIITHEEGGVGLMLQLQVGALEEGFRVLVNTPVVLQQCVSE